MRPAVRMAVRVRFFCNEQKAGWRSEDRCARSREKKMKTGRSAAFGLCLVLILLCASVPRAEDVPHDPKAPSYANSRYGFSLQWLPGKYSVVESDNGDGITVKDGKGLTMLAYGGMDPATFELSIEDAMSEARESLKQVTYEKLDRKGCWFALSGYAGDGKIRYIKCFYGPSECYTLEFTYPAKARAEYDKFVEFAVRHFVPGGDIPK